MNKQIAALILQWHEVYVALGGCIESARVVLDQSDRGTLLPDRVREMRGELLAVQEKIPALADMMEELTGEVSWPMKPETPHDVAAHEGFKSEQEEAAEVAPAKEPDLPTTATGDYDAEGATPVENEAADNDFAAAADAPDEEAASEADTTGAP